VPSDPHHLASADRCDAPGDPATVVAWQPGWPERFAVLGAALRAALGPVAIRIDHIGSTAVPGLAAKPIIDVQVSVAALEPMDPFRIPLEHRGFRWRADNPDCTRRYFRESPGMIRTHIHVRRTGSFGEQFALLFRDYLRAHPDEADSYAALKRELAPLLRTDRPLYTDRKDPFIWDMMRLASAWSQRTRWRPGPSDA
jgi:GrpB-like predicted nucleotidyltransferase (UPF0157 family)